MAQQPVAAEYHQDRAVRNWVRIWKSVPSLPSQLKTHTRVRPKYGGIGEIRNQTWLGGEWGELLWCSGEKSFWRDQEGLTWWFSIVLPCVRSSIPYSVSGCYSLGHIIWRRIANRLLLQWTSPCRVSSSTSTLNTPTSRTSRFFKVCSCRTCRIALLDIQI